MADELVLEILLWLCIILSLPLLLFSSGAYGRHFADLEYQKEAGLNGTRQIQSKVNLRKESNRVLVAAVFLLVAIMTLVDADPYFRAWTARLGFISILAALSYSSVKDWLAARAQIRHVLNDPIIPIVADLREQIHSVKSNMQSIVTYAELPTRTSEDHAAFTRCVDELNGKLEKLHKDVRALDPTLPIVKAPS